MAIDAKQTGEQSGDTRYGVGSSLDRYPWGSWLARKDSHLRSPDPESVYRNQAREPPFERAAGLCRPPNRGESGAHPEMSQMPIPKTERVCCPIWASPILTGGAAWLNCSAHAFHGPFDIVLHEVGVDRDRGDRSCPG